MASRDDAFAALSAAVLELASETQLEPVLSKLVDRARELVGAKYAALGIPDGRGGFAKFLTSGMSDELIDEIGPLPRTHGLLAALFEDTASFRVADVTKDPRFEWWPPAHPYMRSFLGVPIVARGTIVGAIYLTDKQRPAVRGPQLPAGSGEHAAEFDDDDQRLIELFAAHAAIAIENATLFERSRELTVVEERNRLARDLHDSVVQTLFGLSLAAEAARNGAAEQIEQVNDLAKQALAELRSIVFELRPADLAAEGLVPTLVKHAEVLQRVFGQDIDVQVLSAGTLDPSVELELFRIVQEALSNALKHAQAAKVQVVVDLEAIPARIEVIDDGQGFDPTAVPLRARHLGLLSMEERAGTIGGTLRIDSAPGRGTRVTVEVVLR